MNKIKTLALVLLGTFCTSSLFAVGTATVNEDFEITISTISADGKYVLTLDTDITFKDDAQKKDFFFNLMANMEQFEMDPSSKEIILVTHPEYLSTAWTASEWTTHLADNAAHYKAFYQHYVVDSASDTSTKDEIER